MDKRTRELMHSSDDDEAITPQDFYEQIAIEFPFGTDLAASHQNSKCDYFFDEEMNSLEQNWEGINWCNPPYGRGVIHWVAKASIEAERGACIVMLLVPRTDTRWFEIAANTADEIRFIKGRLQFEGQPNKAPFPSCLVIWYGSNTTRMYPPPEGPYEYNLIWRR